LLEIGLTSSTRFNLIVGGKTLPKQPKIDTKRVATAVKMTRFITEFMDTMYNKRR
jgi:hypothetical protein